MKRLSLYLDPTHTVGSPNNISRMVGYLASNRPIYASITAYPCIGRRCGHNYNLKTWLVLTLDAYIPSSLLSPRHLLSTEHLLVYST